MSSQPQAYPGYQPFVNQSMMPGQKEGIPAYPTQPMGAVNAAYPTQPMGPMNAAPAFPAQGMGPMNFPPQPPPAGGFLMGSPYAQAGGFPNQVGFMPTPVPMHPQVFPNIPPQQPQDDFSEAKDLTADWKGFTNKAVRALFIRKVYAILMVQLAVSFGVVCLFVFEKHVNYFVRTHLWVYLLAYFTFLGVYIALICCGNVRRKYPTNVIMLSIFTLAKSYMLGVISSFHETKSVCIAIGVCAAVCLLVSVFSFHSKFDFTTWGGALFILCWVLFLFGIIAIMLRHEIMTAVYAGLGTLLFVAFLAYDTQMIMGGKKHELSAEEHIFAAICLYLDIVYIFMFILMAFGKK